MSRTHNCAAPFDPHLYRYPSRRTVAYAQNGMVCTSVPLAAQAGLDILKKGGNAIDAAIATAMSLTVLEPTSNGVGGDAFALVWTKGKLYGINGQLDVFSIIGRRKRWMIWVIFIGSNCCGY